MELIELVSYAVNGVNSAVMLLCVTMLVSNVLALLTALVFVYHKKTLRTEFNAHVQQWAAKKLAEHENHLAQAAAIKADTQAKIAQAQAVSEALE
jgi:predicted histidine transporter YuiF (NhaC family)